MIEIEIRQSGSDIKKVFKTESLRLVYIGSGVKILYIIVDYDYAEITVLNNLNTLDINQPTGRYIDITLKS